MCINVDLLETERIGSFTPQHPSSRLQLRTSRPAAQMGGQQLDVAIVGAGLGGIALALFLQQHGFRPQIFELREQESLDGGYLALAPNALRVLDRIGAYKAVAAHGFNYEEQYFVSARNLSRIGTIWTGNEAKYGYRAVRVARSHVRHTLLDLAKERGVPIRYGMECVEVEDGGEKGRATITFASGQKETADFVIGADGLHSRVRHLIDPSCNTQFSGQMGIGGQVERAKLGGLTDNMLLPAIIVGKNSSFMFMPCTFAADKIGVFATIEAEDRSREEWSAMIADKPALAKMYQESHLSDSEWPEVVQVAVEKVEVNNLSLWPFFQVSTLSDWSMPSRNVILIGDAAHGIPPTGGQGAAMAFEDAATLSDALLECSLAGDAEKEPILWQWEERRKLRVAEVVKFTTRSGDTRKSSPSLPQQLFKEWIMWLYFLIRGKELGLAWMYAYNTSEEAPYLVSKEE